MRQIFFIADQLPAITGANVHGWRADDQGKLIGVVEMDGQCDCEHIIEQLEQQAVSWLPNHHGSEPIRKEHADLLAVHGVKNGDTTMQAMSKVHAVSGFHHLRPKRF